ncbi:class I SAM-dependent methyltransferase [Candidatus Woesearchaeota archaeon]|nr:class I SAM-dependent methyltransferase [Candidatus Woesearchaeota archaeon]
MKSNNLNANHPSYYRKGFDTWIPSFYDLFVSIALFGNQDKIREMFVNKLKEQGKRPKKILDMATGTGDVAIKLKKAFPEADVTGIDLSTEMLAFAKKKADKNLLDISFIQQNIETTTFNEGYFDAVTISLGLHEIPEENRLNTIKEAYRILKKGGKFIIMDFNKPTNWLSRLLQNLHFILFEPKYAKSILTEDLIGELKTQGFREPKKEIAGMLQIVYDVK